MKKRHILLLLALLLISTARAQSGQLQPGQVAIAPYVDEMSAQPQARSLLMDKMRQMVTAAGLSSIDIGERFIITAHVLPLRSEQTATIPVKTVVQLSVTFYIGNAADGVLFTSHNAELRGVGQDEDQAYMNALRCISPTAAEWQAFVQQGRQRIEDYYGETGADIVAKARQLAASGSYVEAVEELLALPASCPQYAEAQRLIGEYGGSYLAQVEQAEREQMAREEAQAQRNHETTLAVLQTEQQRLQTEQQRLLTEQSLNEKEATTAKAAARVAMARYESRQKRVYDIQWW